MTTPREQVTAEFGGLVRLIGWRYELHGIEIVLDDEYSDEDAAVILDDLSATLDVVHPALRAKLTRVLLPRVHHPAEASTGATADGATGQVCFWRMRQSMFGLPHTDIGLVLTRMSWPGSACRRRSGKVQRAGPFGFDYHRGGTDQIWIAGGIGITPFLSWIRAMDASFDRTVAFNYSVAHEADALYREEIDAAAAEHATLRARIVDTQRDGFLTAEKTMAGRAPAAEVWVYMCGPPPMMWALGDGFRRLGVPASRVRWEQFDIR